MKQMADFNSSALRLETMSTGLSAYYRLYPP